MTTGPVQITLDAVSFSLKEPHDFSWIKPLGQVFCVFDQQNSGNLCFGVAQNGRKLFVKYAGARTLEFEGSVDEAIGRLARAVPVHKALKHAFLIGLIDSFPTPNGYAMVFEWFDGDTLHEHWKFPPPEKYTNPNSAFYKFRHLPLKLRLDALDRIYSFHEHVESAGYVAVDFYDGSLLYDFANNRMRICDVDFYGRKPFVNTMGRLWGSSRFMSPEEFVMGAAIDERTNVYSMGATAFCLMGGEKDRSFEKWDGSRDLYRVAQKATSDDRSRRYASVKEFYREWQECRGEEV
jgi:serine/threonine-protein kinase